VYNENLRRYSLLAFYQEASAIDAKEAFSWIAEAKGPWDSTDGLEFLAEEAFQCFGKRSQEYRHTFCSLEVTKIWRDLYESGKYFAES